MTYEQGQAILAKLDELNLTLDALEVYILIAVFTLMFIKFGRR